MPQIINSKIGKYHIMLLLLLPTCMLITGCVNLRGPDVPLVPPTGFIYTKFTAPLTTEFEDTKTSTSKRAEVSTNYLKDTYYSNLDVAWGEATINKAAEEVGIDQVEYVEYRYLSILGIYERLTLIIYGD